MKSILTRLAANPLNRITIENDQEAMLLLFECGVTDKVKRAKMPLPAPTVKCVTLDTVPSHIIVGFLWEGHEIDSDNGYIVYCFPRSTTSEAEINKFVAGVLRTTEASGGKFEAFPNSPQN